MQNCPSDLKLATHTPISTLKNKWNYVFDTMKTGRSGYCVRFNIRQLNIFSFIFSYTLFQPCLGKTYRLREAGVSLFINTFISKSPINVFLLRMRHRCLKVAGLFGNFFQENQMTIIWQKFSNIFNNKIGNFVRTCLVHLVDSQRILVP